MKDKMSPKAEPNHPLRAGELFGIRRPKWDRDFLRWIMPNCQEIPFEKKHQNLNLRIAYLTRISIDLKNFKKRMIRKNREQNWGIGNFQTTSNPTPKMKKKG
ncbi:MAG: hypothetical protein K5920_11485 [Bacteroidales bacterium]|nr:hypothetical protein [Bacteroidales bacterium]